MGSRVVGVSMDVGPRRLGRSCFSSPQTQDVNRVQYSPCLGSYCVRKICVCSGLGFIMKSMMVRLEFCSTQITINIHRRRHR